MADHASAQLSESASVVLKTPVFFLTGRSAEEKIAYAPLRRLAFSVNPAGEEFLRALEKGLPRMGVTPREASFLAGVEKMGLFEELPDEPARVTEVQTDEYRPTTVSLFLTGKCNLHCTYCYARGGDTDSLMSWEVAQGALDFVIENALATNAPKVQVIFHGDGEPTLAWPVLQAAVEYTERRTADLGLACSFEAGLNGIISEKRLRWLAGKLSGATVSLDGPPDIQDAQRPLTSPAGARRAAGLRLSRSEPADETGLSSSWIVERTLGILDEMKVAYGIRCTITRHSVARIAEIVEYFCRVSQTKFLQLETVFPVGRAIETAEPAVDPETFVRSFLAGRLVAREHGRRLVYAAARADQITNRFCEAITGAFNVTQDGRVTSCYEVFDRADPRMKHFGIGSYDRHSRTFQVDRERIGAAARWTAMEKLPCRSCFAKYHCAGDCSAKTALSGDPAAGVNPNRCYVIRELTRAQIFSLYGFGDVKEPSGTWQMRETQGALVQIQA